MTLRPIGKTDEDIEDVVAALLAAGNALDVTYDDENGTLTVDVSENAIGTGELSFDTATQDELDAVESSAADARTDLRFALYPEEIDASTRDTYYQNFEKFANSAAMTSIAASAVVMDEVSVSDTALDAIWESQTAWDIVKAKSMAVGKFAAGRAGLDGANYTDIDAVSTSQTAMDAVSTSQTAMDAVSVSTVAMEAVAASALAMDAVIASDDIALPTIVEEQIAMDAVSTSATAMDAVSSSDLAMDAVDAAEVARNAVTAVEMASAKFLAGRSTLDPSLYTTLDGVGSDLPTDDQTAMDAVSTSQTAMDAVSASTTAMNAAASAIMPRTRMLLGAYYDAIFSSGTGSEEFFNNSTINPSSGNIEGLPYTYDATGSTGASYNVDLSTNVPTEFDGGYSIRVDANDDYENNDQAWAEVELDLTEASTLDVWAEDNDPEAVLLIDGSVVSNLGRQFSWTEFNIDVSSYSGTHTIGLGSNFTGGYGETYYSALNLR